MNGFVVIAIDSGGSMHPDWGETANDAKRKTLRFCKSQGGKGCKTERILESPAA